MAKSDVEVLELDCEDLLPSVSVSKPREENTNNGDMFIDGLTEEKVLNSVDTIMKDMFIPIVELCGGNLLDNEMIASVNNPNEEIKKAFEYMKKCIKDELIPNEILKEIVKPSSLKQGKQTKYTCKVCDETIPYSKVVIKVHMKKHKPSDHSLPPAAKPTVTQDTGDLLDRQCPLPGCTFRTSKQGMRNLEAANHLVRLHGLTFQDIRQSSDRFTFRKVQV